MRIEWNSCCASLNPALGGEGMFEGDKDAVSEVELGDVCHSGTSAAAAVHTCRVFWCTCGSSLGLLGYRPILLSLSIQFK